MRRLLLVAALAGCTKPAPPAPTVALAESARPGVVLVRGDETIPVDTDRRVEVGAELRTPESGRATLHLDGGAWALLDARTRAGVTAAGLELRAGRAWIDARDVEALSVTVPGGTLTATAAGFAVEVDAKGARAYCVSGQLTYAAATSNRLEAGMSVRISPDGRAVEEPETQWDDWTGGLAEPGPPRALEPAGVGMLSARRSDEIGSARTPLLVRRHDVRARIDRDFAITDVVQVFFNPRSEIVEGVYSVRLPKGAILGRFDVIAGEHGQSPVEDWLGMAPQIVGRVRPGEQAGAIALEWAGPDRYRARLDAVAAGKTVTVRVSYVEWLVRHGKRRAWVYPMGSASAGADGGQAPLLGEFSLDVDASRAEAGALEAGMGARVEGTRVVLRRSDFRPRADFALELLDRAEADAKGKARIYRSPGAESYVLVNAETPVGKPPATLDLVLVADTSAGTDPTRLDLEKAVVDGILRQLTPGDRVALLAASVDARPLGAGPPLAPLTRERAEELLDALARQPAAGATDLGASLAQAAALLPGGRGVVVYIGDGRPTVGALSPGGVADRLARLAHPPRVFSVGVGADAKLDLLSAIAGSGGLTVLVEDRPQAAHAAYRVLAAAALPTLREVSFDLGPEVDVLYPTGPAALSAGEPLRVIGRVRGTEAPKKLALRGLRDGEPFREEIALTPAPIDEGGDLRRRWAQGRLDNLLARGAGREAVTEIGSRFGLVTPWSALVVGGGTSYRPLVGVEEAGTYVPASLRDDAPDDSAIALEEGVTSAPSGSQSLPDLYRRYLGGRDEGVRVCYDRKAAGHPELSGRVEVRIRVGLAGEVASAQVISSSLRNAEVEACMVRAILALRLPPPPDTKPLEVVRAWQFEAEDGRLGSTERCSAASHQYLASRRALWRERLAGNPGVEGAMATWRRAERACELKTWLDRRALLDLLRPHVGTTVYQVDLYHRFAARSDIQDHLRREILRAVRTAEDVRAIRGGLALDGGVSVELLTSQLARALDPAARIRVVRQFLALAPDGIALRLRLLALLEEAASLPQGAKLLDEARRVAWSLRGDPAADLQARQAVGEFFARHAQPDEAARAFSEIVEFAPFDPWARRRLGDLYRAHGRFEDAYREYATLAWLTPDDGAALLLLAQAAAGAGRIDEALRLQERLAEATAAAEGSNDVPSWARAWNTVRLAALRAEARSRSDGPLLERLAARGRSDGLLTWASETFIGLTASHPDARLELSITAPDEKVARRAPLQGGSVGIEAIRLARQGARDQQIAVRRPAAGADRLRTFEADLWVLWGEAGSDEKLTRIPLRFGPGVALRTFTLRGREVVPGREVALASVKAAP
ncbi:MAG: AgmX/PglI C-terminal domain-containing protein [Myxococcales bacterium]|nr:AgmX/PglI C-terminal domain-containing protein [Myxococcales bacterium]